jgi:hypothetical protein
VPVPGTGSDAAGLVCAIVAHDDQPITTHQIAARTPSRLLPKLVEQLVNRSHAATANRRTAHSAWHTAINEFTAAIAHARDRATDRSRTRDHSRDSGLEF